MPAATLPSQAVKRMQQHTCMHATAHLHACNSTPSQRKTQASHTLVYCVPHSCSSLTTPGRLLTQWPPSASTNGMLTQGSNELIILPCCSCLQCTMRAIHRSQQSDNSVLQADSRRRPPPPRVTNLLTHITRTKQHTMLCGSSAVKAHLLNMSRKNIGQEGLRDRLLIHTWQSLRPCHTPALP
jgi:hypothetical protein